MKRKIIRQYYENVDSLNEKGKVVTNVKYKGEYFAPENEKAYLVFKILSAALSVTAAALYFLPLTLNNNCMRTIYFVVPYIGQVFIIFFLLLAAYKLLTKKPPFTLLEKKSVKDNPKGLCITGIVMSGASIVSFIIFRALNGAHGVDFTALAGALGCLGCYVGMLMGNKYFSLLPQTENDSE